ncbi:MAG: tRNA ((37)-N6)-dimethylallyltransferase MiaA, partial [Hyphomicrobiales bacterium]|nr:tRNA ((37)-N6)-dimethylallyltransferase MiaA [Hyphomicrobiales bacterium]
IAAAGRMPIFAGGTGLYFKALLHGLSDIPKVPDEIRARVRTEAEGMTPEALHARLAARDPVTAARLRPSDPQRILRALEVFEATGLPLRHFQDRRGAPLLDGETCACVFLEPDRNELHRRIDARFDAMMAQGALEEVTALAARNLDPALPAMRAHGVPGLIAYLRGELSLDDAIAKGKIDTRHYSKRQFTWFRHQLPQFKWMTPAAVVDEFDTLLRKR